MTNHKKTYSPFKRIPWGRRRFVKEIRLRLNRNRLSRGVLSKISEIRDRSLILRRFESLTVGVLKILAAGYRSAFPRNNGSVSMKSQLMLLLVGLSILPVLIMGILAYNQAEKAIMSAQESMLSAHAQGIRHSLESVLAGAEDTLNGLASQSNVLILMEDVNQDGIVNDTTLLNTTGFSLKNAVKGSDKLYESAFIADKSGKILVEGSLGKTSTVGQSILDTDYYKGINGQEEFAVGAPFQSEATKRLVIPVATTIKTLAGRTGTLVVLFDHQRFMEFLSTSSIGTTGAIYILDHAGSTVYNPVPDKTMTPLSSDLFTDKIKVDTPEISKGFDQYKDPEGVRLAAWDPLGSAGWTIVATLSKGEFEKGILQIRFFMGGVVLITALLASVVALRYAETLTRPIKALGILMNRVAGGELEVEGVHRPNQEVAELNDSFNSMLQNLKKLIFGISEASDSVAETSQSLGALSAQTLASAENMLDSVEEIAKGSQTQSNEAAEGVLLIHTMAASVREIHTQTEGILSSSRSSEAVSAMGLAQLQLLGIKSDESLEASRHIQEEVVGLNEELQRIGGIIEAISKIAKTTNLLALNAAIEAARAGDAGRGFTVVAQEVRKLADQTAQEASSIRTILSAIKEKSLRMDTVVLKNEEAVNEQHLAVTSTKEAFSQISQEIHTTTEKVTRIAEAIAALDQSKDEIIQSVSAIAAVAAQSSDAAQTARAATQEQFSSVEHLRNEADALHFLSAKLVESIRMFKSEAPSDLNVSVQKVFHTLAELNAS